MTHKTTQTAEPSVTDLVKGIIDDVQALLQEQVELVKQEVREEVGRAGKAAAEAGAGAGLFALAGVMSAHTIALLLHQSTRLPLWASYGLVGALAGAGGLVALSDARRRAASVQLVPPPQSAAALRENLAWVKQEVSGRAE